MDSFDIKAEKRNAILKHRRLRKIAHLLRLIEVCVVLVLVSRFTTNLPVTVFRNSGEYFRGLTVALVSPRFVFIVGNVIVITLFAKSGQFSCQNPTAKNSGTDIYEEFLERSEKTSQAISQRYQIECREKQSEHEEKRVNTSSGTKDYRRSKSENFKRINCNKACHQLRRSETENGRKSSSSSSDEYYPCDKTEKNSYPQDDMSNEEFRHKIEAFIARHKQFRRDEEYAVI